MTDKIKTRFLRKVCKTDNCWEWTAALDECGYGRFMLDGNNFHAHRLSWILHVGAIPAGLFVLHRCDNARCVNPEHLYLGTQRDNMRDCVDHGRHRNASKTHCIHGHVLDMNNTYHYNNTHRGCIECRRTAAREYARRSRGYYAK